MDAQTETPGEPVKKNKGGRPRKVVTAAAPQFTEDQFERFLAAVAGSRSESSGGGLDPTLLKDLMEAAAKASAQATEKAANPSNKTHPGISSLSHPLGDREKPREHLLPFEFWWNGFPVHKAWETHHYRELELFARLTPGEYTVSRKDGSSWPEKAKVKGTYSADGTLMRLDYELSIQRSEKDQVAPMFVTAYQMLHSDQAARKTYIAAMVEWMQITLAGDEVPVPVGA